MVLTLSIFVRQKSLYSKKKEPKSASRRLNKLKKRVLKNFLDKILNYRSAGPLPVPVPVAGTRKLNFTGTRTGAKRKILAGPEPGPEPNKKSYRDLDRDRDQKKLVPHISNHKPRLVIKF
jgi:hypothetical protein